jgi:hypothetical protein
MGLEGTSLTMAKKKNKAWYQQPLDTRKCEKRKKVARTSVSGLDKLGLGLHDLTGSSVDLLDEGVELALEGGEGKGREKEIKGKRSAQAQDRGQKA